MAFKHFCDNCGRVWEGGERPIMVGKFTACTGKCAKELRQPTSGPSDRELRAAERRQLGITE